MKLGKIVEILGIALENGFEVLYGIEIKESGRTDYGFGAIVSAGALTQRTRVTYIYSYYLKKNQDSFKEYIISTDSDPNKKPDSELQEEYLWVVIPYSAEIETNAKRVAGRYHTEAILEMYEGEKVTVRKAGGTPETYMVAKAGNELFLVKKNR